MSAKRITQYLQAEELDENSVNYSSNGKGMSCVDQLNRSIALLVWLPLSLDLISLMLSIEILRIRPSLCTC